MNNYLKANWPFVFWVAGIILFFIGEGYSAFDKKQGNTASEYFVKLPEPAKFFVVGGMCAVIAHWVWPVPSVTIEGDMNVTVTPKSK